MDREYSPIVNTARDYYNSPDADGFYSSVWGGKDIHVGIYASPDEPIYDASRRTVERMAARLEELDADSHVLDIGAGYGGSARYLAATHGCRVTALNLSEVENERSRTMNGQSGLDPLIDLVDASYEDVPFPDGTFDAVWSQDAILHSGDRPRVLAEAARVLKSGGDLVFTDPTQADDCPEGVLEPILDRIHLESLGSPDFYRATARSLDLREVAFEDHTPHLPTHYARVLEETTAHEEELTGQISPEYIGRMKKGLQHWVDGGRKGYLAWGIFHFRS